MKHKKIIFGILALALAVVMPGSAIAAELPPDVLRALYIRNFFLNTVWPEGSQKDKEPVINICVIGDEGEINTGPYEGRANPTLKVVAIDRSSKSLATQCHIVYVSESEGSGVESIVSRLKGQPILTVSSAAKFASRGGMFGLVMVGDKIRFTVNRTAIADANLKIKDPNVLSLAVEEPK